MRWDFVWLSKEDISSHVHGKPFYQRLYTNPQPFDPKMDLSWATFPTFRRSKERGVEEEEGEDIKAPAMPSARRVVSLPGEAEFVWSMDEQTDFF